MTRAARVAILRAFASRALGADDAPGRHYLRLLLFGTL
jgi:hypothetical protein